MSFPSKPKDVCAGCRTRKKKCDGTRPACTPCLKRGGICVYTPPPSNTQLTFNGDSWLASESLDAALTDMGGWPAPGLAGRPLPGTPGMPIATGAFAEAPSWLGLENGIPMTEMVQGLPTPESTSPYSQADQALPSLSAILDLIDVFYERFYPNLPVLHKETLLSRLQTQGVNGVSQLLLLSIITLAASGHPNPQIRASQPHWRTLARDALKALIPTEEHPLQTLQAAVLLILDSLLQGEYPVTWMMLGEAWRKAAVIGYHQVDARDNEILAQNLGSVQGLSWIEQEECRRVVWTFFILDRGLCYPIGMVHAVDERRLVINFPMREEDFQGSKEPSADKPVLKYINDIDRLIGRVKDHGHQGACSMLHYIILAYVLMGRVTEEVYMQESEKENQAAALDWLIDRLVSIRLILPASASDLSVANVGDVAYILWLSAVMSVNTIFLHHRSLRHDDEMGFDDMAAKWLHAVLTARNTVQLLREVYRSGLGSTFMLAHTTAAVFVSTRILIMEYMSPGHRPAEQSPAARDKALRSDLEVLASVSMQSHSSLCKLGRKFIMGFKFYIRMSEQDIRASKEYGAKGLLKRAGDWATADDGKDIVVPE